MAERTGPFEQLDWPTHLRALVVAPLPRPRFHGYDLEQDLAHHYSLAECMLLALTGRVPSTSEGRAFELALLFASACPINEAPTHAAVLARSIGAPMSSALACGFAVACEASHAMLQEHDELLRWLGHDDAREPPPCALATDDRDAEAVAELRRLLEQAEALALAPPPTMSRIAAILTVMWRCGMRSADQLVVALSWAKALSIGAEAHATKRGGLTDMPARLPDYRYEAPDQ